MSSSSGIPPGRPPRRGVPGSNASAISNGHPPSEPTWPLPRKPAAGTEAAPIAGKRALPTPSGANQLRRTRAQVATGSEQTDTHIPDRGREDDVLILVPTALNPSRQTRKAVKLPPSTSNNALSGPAVPDFPSEKRPAPKSNHHARDVQEPPGKGPPAHATAQRGAVSLPDQPGPAPSVPVPTPTKPPRSTNTPARSQRSDQERPPGPSVQNVAPDVQEKRGAAPTGQNADQRGVPSIAVHAPGPNRPGLGPLPPSVQAKPGLADPSIRKPVNQDSLGSSPPRPLQPDMHPSSPPNSTLQQWNSTYGNPSRSSPPNRQLQSKNLPVKKPLSPTPPDTTLQLGNHAAPKPSVYRPSVVSPPPRRQDQANFAPPPITNPPRQMPPAGSRIASPPGFSGARPGPTYTAPHHVHFNSLVPNTSMASSATATSTRPLNPVQRQNNGFSRPSRQNSDPREKGAPGGGGYYPDETGPAQTPYMNMLLSLDRIPRMHNILVSVFVWILSAGFVIMPGSFTSAKRQQEGQTVEIPVATTGGANGTAKLSLTPANTAAMVVGFVCIVAGTFGSAWLALRWRRNYVWLLNKLYLPLVLNALAGLLATVVGVYTQQAGDWSTQAVITLVIEGSILVVNVLLFFVYNYWLLQRLRSDHEEVVAGGEKKEKRKRKKRKGGLFARFRRVRRKPPIAAGSVV